MSINQLISDKILVLFGRNIETEFVTHQQSAKYLGNGINFVEPESLSEKHSTAIIWAHGNVLNTGTPDETATMRNLFPNQFYTIDNLKIVKENANPSTYFLLSCHSGAIYYDLKRHIDEFDSGTTLVAFSSTKHTSISEMNIRRINELTTIYDQQGEVDPLVFFSNNIVCDPQTVLFNRIIIDRYGKKKLLSLKAIAPKTDLEMQDLRAYFKSGKALVCVEGAPDDPDLQELTRIIQQQLTISADALSEKDLQTYKNRALIDSVNRDIGYRVKDWIRRGADVSVLLDNGYNLLHIACFYNHSNAGSELLALNKIDINQPDIYGIPPLHLACRLGNVSMVKALLAHGANPLVKDDEGLTAIHMAYENKQYLELIDTLLRHANFDVNHETDESGDNLFHLACREGRVDLVKLLLTKNQINPNLPNDRDETPLQIACDNGHLEVIKALLSHPQTNPNIPDMFGNTILHQACKIGDVELVKQLIQHPDINVNLPNKKGDTPLLIAEINHHDDICEVLLNDSKVDVNQSNNRYGEKPIVLFYQNNNLPLFKKLLKRKDSNPNSLDEEEKLPLASTVYRDQKYNYLKTLIEHPSFHFSQTMDKRGNTLLHLACQQGDIECVSDILEHDQQVINLANQDGDTALHIACKKNDLYIIKELLSHNTIDTTLTNKEGLTPVQIVQQNLGTKSPIARMLQRYEDKKHTPNHLLKLL